MEIHAVTRKTCTTEPEAVHDHLPTPRPPSRPCASHPLLSSNLASSSSKARPAECKARVKPAPEVAFGSEGPETSSRGWIIADMVPKLLSGDLGASDRMHTALTGRLRRSCPTGLTSSVFSDGLCGSGEGSMLQSAQERSRPPALGPESLFLRKISRRECSQAGTVCGV